MSRLTMLKPADGVQGVKDFVMETVKQAGPTPARPLCWALALAAALINAQLWPKAPLRLLDQPNADPYYAALEKSCWMPSMQPALARRALAVQPPAWASALNSCPPM